MTTRLKQLMDHRQMSAAVLSRASGISPSTLNKLIHGHRKMSVQWAEQLAPYFDVDPTEFFRSLDAPMWETIYPIPHMQKIRARQEAAHLAALNEKRVFGGVDIPVYQSKFVKQNLFSVDFGKHVNKIRRPPAIEHATSVYGFFVVTSNLSKFSEGDIVLVDPDRPPKQGDDVVLYKISDTGEALEAQLGYLFRDPSTSEILVLDNVLENAVHIKLGADPSMRAEKILSIAEILGV